MKRTCSFYSRLGLATAPVLFACEQHPELETLIQRSFVHSGDVEKAFEIVLNSNGLRETMLLAESYATAALNNVKHLKESEAKTALEELAYKVVNRSS